jgi:hypothetical protein
LKRTQISFIFIHTNSAGVGRTGTLIALDILMQEAREKREINVFETVHDLRMQRIGMVQTEVTVKMFCNGLECVTLQFFRTNTNTFTNAYAISLKQRQPMVITDRSSKGKFLKI